MRKSISGLILVGFLLLASQSRADTFAVTASDRAFFQEVKKALFTEDIDWLSRAVSYPLMLNVKNRTIKVDNEAALRRNWKFVFGNELKSVVKNQSFDSLFKNWQGVMIGDGELWFSRVQENGKAPDKTWVYRIIAINLDTDP